MHLRGQVSSLSAGQFHEQLPMFMTAHEINQHKKGDYEAYKTVLGYRHPAEMMADKKSEADFSGLTKDVAKHGVQHPVTLWHDDGGSKTLTDGHHRLAAALATDPHRLMPVQHEDLANSPHLRPWS